MSRIYTAADQLIGHTPLEVYTGVLLGMAVGFLMPM